MNALEFSTIIEHGQITLPDEYKSLENNLVRVIILSDNELKPNSKEQLKEAFISLKNVISLAKIENAVDWQKSLRDDWE
ncbi:MAG: hypothetical protein WCI53_11640 [Bacteroidota bacterium]|jgi:hypothetical protein